VAAVVPDLGDLAAPFLSLILVPSPCSFGFFQVWTHSGRFFFTFGWRFPTLVFPRLLPFPGDARPITTFSLQVRFSGFHPLLHRGPCFILIFLFALPVFSEGSWGWFPSTRTHLFLLLFLWKRLGGTGPGLDTQGVTEQRLMLFLR